jgi:hypothetical protein
MDAVFPEITSQELACYRDAFASVTGLFATEYRCRPRAISNPRRRSKGRPILCYTVSIETLLIAGLPVTLRPLVATCR